MDETRCCLDAANGGGGNASDGADVFESMIANNGQLSMRASSIRHGSHKFNSMDIMPVLGSAVVKERDSVDSFPWQFDMKDPDIEVVVSFFCVGTHHLEQ